MLAHKKLLRYAAVIGILFFAVRLIYLSQLLRSPLLTYLILDSDYYFRWAANLASGHGNPPGPFWLSPLYPYFLSLLFLLPGDDISQTAGGRGQ